MKSAFAECTFPELRGGFAYRSGKGKGSNSKVAVARAIVDAMKQVGRKRVKVVKATVSIVEVAE